MGMLAAVEMWKKRDHKAEWKQWEGWLDQIATSVKRVNGVTTRVTRPGRSLESHARAPHSMGRQAVGITGQEVAKLLLDGEPRIVLAGGSGTRPGNMESSVSVMPYMMMPGDEKIVAERLYAVLSKPPKFENPRRSAGRARVHRRTMGSRNHFLRGSANHTLVLEQHGQDWSARTTANSFRAISTARWPPIRSASAAARESRASTCPTTSPAPSRATRCQAR